MNYTEHLPRSNLGMAMKVRLPLGDNEPLVGYVARWQSLFAGGSGCLRSCTFLICTGPVEPIDNDSLIAALLTDGDRYLGETPAVPPPGAIVVSGDLIQGAANWRS